MNDQSIRKLSNNLDRLGIKYELIKHAPIKTVEDGLKNLGIEASDGVSTLILKADGNFIAVLRRDDNHLDLEKIKSILGLKFIRLATKDEVFKETGLPVGATPMVTGLKTLMDETILEKEVVYGGTGSFEYDVKLKTTDLKMATDAISGDIVDDDFELPTTVEFYIEKVIRDRFPDLEEIVLPIYGISVNNNVILSQEKVGTLVKKMSENTFFDQPEFVSYRKFCDEVKVQSTREFPSVENLYRRYLKVGNFPQVNNIVDSVNLVSLETFVPMGAFDIDQIKGKLVMRYSREGEEFRPLGGGVDHLPAGLIIISDDEKILNHFPFQDSIYQKITDKTKNVLILGDAVGGIDSKKTEAAVRRAGKLIGKLTNGRTGKLSYSKTVEVKSSKPLLDTSQGKITTSEAKKRILTGDTPTGKLHLGHYVGTLENRVKLQKDYDTFIILADLHSFTTLSEYPEKVRQSTFEVALDNLAVGLDPKKVHIFVESQIPEIYELAAIFSMLISHNRALRNPTIKDEIKMKGLGDQYSMGFLNYPLYQAADITCVGAQLVPVGKDQLPHIEQTREIVEKFNSMYGKVLIKPECLVGKVGKLVGTDGSPKMSKSLGNTITLSDPEEIVKEKVMRMFTDPKRVHPTDQGEVEGNPVFIYHDAFNSNKEEVKDLKERYKKGTVGDVEVKEKLVKVLNNFLDPIRERRTYYESHPDEVMEILKEGTRVTREEAQKTLEVVRKAMKMNY